MILSSYRTHTHTDSWGSICPLLDLFPHIVFLIFSSPVPQYKDGKKLKPKPNYNSVDLAEVEWEDIDETVSISSNKDT